MFFVWLQRLILLALLAIGAIFTLENRHSILINSGGHTYEVPLYLVVFTLLSTGFIIGVIITSLGRRTPKKEQVKPSQSISAPHN